MQLEVSPLGGFLCLYNVKDDSHMEVVDCVNHK